MELHAFDRIPLVAQAHDHGGAVGLLGARRDLQLARQVAFRHDERVVARRRERLRQAAKDGAVVVLHLAGLAVHERFGAHHFSAESRADGLMPQTHAEDGRAASHPADQFDADARILRRARAGRDDDALRAQRFHLGHAHLVVAAHIHLRPQFTEILDEVVGEGIVVIEDEDHQTQSVSRSVSQSVSAVGLARLRA